VTLRLERLVQRLDRVVSGCPLRRLMFNAAHLAESRKLYHSYGFKGQDASLAAAGFDFAAFKVKRDAYVAWLNTAYRDDLVDTKIDVIDGKASFVGPRRVRIVGTEQEVEVCRGTAAPADNEDLTSCPLRRLTTSSSRRVRRHSCRPSLALSTPSPVTASFS
jgi:hypothetical protein